MYSQYADNPSTGESMGLNSQTNQWEPVPSASSAMPVDKYPMQTQMESGGDPNAISPAGAYGLKQLMPETAANPGFGIQPVKDDSPEENMRVGNQYMDAMLNRYGDPYAAAAAYNWGPGKVDKWVKDGANHADLPDETRNYANKLAPQLAGQGAISASGITAMQQGVQQQQQNPSAPVAQVASNMYSQYADNPQTGEVIGLNSQTGQWETPKDQTQASQSGEFMKGVHRSISDTANLMENALPALGKSAANELFGTSFDNKQDLIDYTKRSADIEKQYGAKVSSISDIHAPSDVMPYLTGLAGENVAGLIPVAGEGYLGAKLMAPALEDVSKEAVAKYIASDAAKQGASDLTDLEARKAIRDQIASKGAALAVVGSMAPQQMASEYMSLMAKGQDDPMGAALIGGLEAGVYALPAGKVYDQIMGKQGAEAVTRTVADEVGAPIRTQEEVASKTAWQERYDKLKNFPAVQTAMKDAGYLGATNMASEAIGVLGEGILGANPEIFSGDNFVRIINAGINGAVGGGLAGGAVGAMHGPLPSMDIRNMPGANRAAGTKRTTLDTDETVKAPVKEGQQEMDLQASNGQPISQINPATSNLSDPSILRPSLMTDEQLALAKKHNITTEDLHFAIDHLDSDEDKKAALSSLFNYLTPSSDERQGRLPLISDFDHRVNLIMKQRPDLDRMNAESIVEAQDQRNQAARDKQMASEGAKYNEDGSITRQVTPESIQGKPAFVENPEAKIGVHDPNGVKAHFQKVETQKELQKQIQDNEIERSKLLKINPDPQSPEHLDLVNKSMGLINKFRELESVDPAKTQKGDTPSTGNMLGDVSTPIRVANNMRYVKLTHEAKPILNNIIDHLARITKEVTGKATQFLPVRRLLEDGSSDYVAGAQVGNLVMTAMPDHYVNHPSVKAGLIPRRLVETTYHENAHFLYNHVFGEDEKNVIRNEGEGLRDYFMQDKWLSNQGDFDVFMASPQGRDELFANAVGKEGAKRFFKDEDQMKGIPFQLRPFVKKIIDWTDKVRSMVRGVMGNPDPGKTSLQRLMDSTLEGKYAGDHIQDAMFEVQRNRVGQMVAQLQKVNSDDAVKAMDEALKPYDPARRTAEEVKSFNGNRGTNPKSMGLITTQIQSFRGLADRWPMFSPAYNLFNKGQADGRGIMDKASQLLNQGYQQLPKSDRYLVHDMLAAVGKSEGKIVFDSKGNAQIPYDSSSMKNLPFDHANLKDGDIVSLKDNDLNKGIKSLQDTYKSILDQKESQWRDLLSRSFADMGLTRDFTKDHLDVVKTKLDPEDPLFKEKLSRLDSAKDDMDGLAKMRKQEYVPRIRYGDSAYVVKYRDVDANGDNRGKTADLLAVEHGFFGTEYDKNSMAKAQGQLKKYMDKPDLYSVHDSKDRVTKDKLSGQYRELANPIKLTHNDIQNHYGLTGDNLAIMSGLLNSRDVDPDRYNQLRDMLASKVSSDKFSRMFKASDKLPGHSTDWDRVLHSYLTTSAHYLGGMEFNRQLPEFQKAYQNISSKELRERAENHFGKPGQRGYINSGKSDFGMLRTVNYLWCMGGNMSSLLVESLKIPTVTLANMHQFRPSILQNLNSLRQYGARFYSALPKIIAAKDQFGGHLVTPLHDDAFLEHMFPGDKEKQSFIKNIAANYGNITEASANRTYGGGDIYGSETGKAQVQGVTNTIQRYLSTPLSVVEQGNRLLSFASTYDAMKDLEAKSPGKLDAILQKSQIYQDLRQRNPDWKPWQAGAMYAVDEENGAPGKIDRSPYLQGIGGAFIQPFFSFDQQALEGICKMLNRGTDGKKAFGVLMGSLAMTAGLMGLPGMRLLVKGGQAIQNSVQGTDYDWEQASREMMAPAIGSRNSLMVTNGLLRAYGGMEISQRISLPLPGEELLMNLLGVDAGKTSDLLGVEGSMIQNAGNAWRSYQNGQSIAASLGQMLPNSVANIEKAYQLTQRGAMNNIGGNATRAIPPDQLSNWSVISRALGMTSDQIASANEQIYAQKMKAKELQTADNRFTQQAANFYMLSQDAQRNGDAQAAADNQQKFMATIQAKAAFAQQHGVPANMPSFMNQLKQTSIQRQMPTAATKQNLGGKTGIYNGSIGVNHYFSNLKGDL